MIIKRCLQIFLSHESQANCFKFADNSMKKFPFLFSLLFLIGTICSKAQDTALLHLRNMVDDTVKVNSFVAYGRTFNRTEPEKAISIYNEALAIAQKIKDENGV